jgi:hypothetical protein
MLFNIIDTLENKLKKFEDLLKKFSSDNLKSMLCIHSDISNKPGLTVDLSTSTSHASDFELDYVDIKPVIVDAACSENSCLNNCVKQKSKDTLMVSLFLLVIIVGRLVILGQIVICWNPTGLGLSRILWGKVKLKILPQQNMSLRIGDI